MKRDFGTEMLEAISVIGSVEKANSKEKSTRLPKPESMHYQKFPERYEITLSYPEHYLYRHDKR